MHDLDADLGCSTGALTSFTGNRAGGEANGRFLLQLSAPLIERCNAILRSLQTLEPISLIGYALL